MVQSLSNPGTEETVKSIQSFEFKPNGDVIDEAKEFRNVIEKSLSKDMSDEDKRDIGIKIIRKIENREMPGAGDYSIILKQALEATKYDEEVIVSIHNEAKEDKYQSQITHLALLYGGMNISSRFSVEKINLDECEGKIIHLPKDVVKEYTHYSLKTGNLKIIDRNITHFLDHLITDESFKLYEDRIKEEGVLKWKNVSYNFIEKLADNQRDTLNSAFIGYIRNLDNFYDYERNTENLLLDDINNNDVILCVPTNYNGEQSETEYKKNFKLSDIVGEELAHKIEKEDSEGNIDYLLTDNCREIFFKYTHHGETHSDLDYAIREAIYSGDNDSEFYGVFLDLDEDLEDGNEYADEFISDVMEIMNKNGELFTYDNGTKESEDNIFKAIKVYYDRLSMVQKENFCNLIDSEELISQDALDTFFDIKKNRDIVVDNFAYILGAIKEDIEKEYLIPRESYYLIKELQSYKNLHEISEVPNVEIKSSDISTALLHYNNISYNTNNFDLGVFINNNITETIILNTFSSQPSLLKNIDAYILGEHISVEAFLSKIDPGEYYEQDIVDAFTHIASGFSGEKNSLLLNNLAKNYIYRGNVLGKILIRVLKSCENQDRAIEFVKKIHNKENNLYFLGEYFHSIDSSEIKSYFVVNIFNSPTNSNKFKNDVAEKIFSSVLDMGDPESSKTILNFAISKDSDFFYKDNELTTKSIIINKHYLNLFSKKYLNQTQVDFLTQFYKEAFQDKIMIEKLYSYAYEIKGKGIFEGFNDFVKGKIISMNSEVHLNISDVFQNLHPIHIKVLGEAYERFPDLIVESESYLLTYIRNYNAEIRGPFSKSMLDNYKTLSLIQYDFERIPLEDLELMFDNFEIDKVLDSSESFFKKENEYVRLYNRYLEKNIGISLEDLKNGSEKKNAVISDAFFERNIRNFNGRGILNHLIENNLGDFSHEQLLKLLELRNPNIITTVRGNYSSILELDKKNQGGVYRKLYILLQYIGAADEDFFTQVSIPSEFLEALSGDYKELGITFSKEKFKLIFKDGIKVEESGNINYDKAFKLIEQRGYDFSKFIYNDESVLSGSLSDSPALTKISPDLIEQLLSKYCKNEKYDLMNIVLSKIQDGNVLFEMYKNHHAVIRKEDTTFSLGKKLAMNEKKKFYNKIAESGLFIVGEFFYDLLDGEGGISFNTSIIKSTDINEDFKSFLVDYLENGKGDINYKVKNIQRIYEEEAYMFERSDETIEQLANFLNDPEKQDSYNSRNTAGFKLFNLDINKFNNYTASRSFSTQDLNLNETYKNLEASLTQQYKNLTSHGGFLENSINEVQRGNFSDEMKHLYSLGVKDLVKNIHSIDKAIGISISDGGLNLQSVKNLSRLPDEVKEEFDHSYESISKAFLFKEEFEQRILSGEKYLYDKTKKHIENCISDLYKTSSIPTEEIDELNKNLFYVEIEPIKSEISNLVEKELKKVSLEIFKHRAEIQDQELKKEIKIIKSNEITSATVKKICAYLKSAIPEDKVRISKIIQECKKATNYNSLVQNCSNENINNFKSIFSKFKKLPDILDSYEKEITSIQSKIQNLNIDIEEFVFTAIEFGKKHEAQQIESVKNISKYGKELDRLIVKFRSIKNTVTSHLQDDFGNINLEEIKRISSEKRDYTLQKWDRKNIFENLNMGHFTHCCIAPDGMNAWTVPLYIKNDNFNVIEIRTNDKIVGQAFTYIGATKRNTKHLVVDNVEINNSYSMDSEQISDNLKEYFKGYRDHIGGLEDEIFIGNSYNDVSVTGKKVKAAEIIGVKDVYLDSTDYQALYTK